MFLALLFWISLSLLALTYLAFPFTLMVLASFFGKKDQHPKSKADAELPTVSILIAAYNEEAVIAEKLANCLALDYPQDKLRIWIGDDGSSDRTAELVRGAQKRIPSLRLVQAPQNAGKAAMLNMLAKEAKAEGAEMFLFTDANTVLLSDSVKNILTCFDDKKIGAVCGRLALSSGSASLSQGESTYWNLETRLKQWEGRLGAVMGCNGALYAIRSELYPRQGIPTAGVVMDDFYVTVSVFRAGFQCVFAGDAVGMEQTSKDKSGEFRRKVRIGRANFNYLLSYLPLLNPVHPIRAYLFFAHKLLRWLSPFLLAGLLAGSFAYPVVPPLICVFGLLALFRVRFPFYFLSMNWALLLGIFQSFLPEKNGAWERVERDS
jgi:cellulose synthase/poly-beta-1,6-N-acetylglucosamine synthase-like glycosyltransferase